MENLISGIQQVGIGVGNADETVKWYAKFFGFKSLVFMDEAEAALMTDYTGGEVHKRKAYLTLNLQGGGGFETWQFTSRTPGKGIEVKGGELGINVVKIKCKSPVTVCEWMKAQGAEVRVENDRFWVFDLHGNWFELVPFDDWFEFPKGIQNGGVCGVTLGVSNIEKSAAFFIDNLGFKLKDGSTTLTVNGRELKSQKLTFNNLKKGHFSGLLGNVEIELWENTAGNMPKLYENRFWGDLGFIHVCFDVIDMEKLQKRFASNGTKFVVDSANSFSMGEAAGRFAYIEDPDGTLIELVETHKVAIFKKIGWYFNLQKRNADTPLPKWQVKLLGINKVKQG